LRGNSPSATAASPPGGLCLHVEEHEKSTLDDVEQLVANLRSLASPNDHGPALAVLRRTARG